MPDDLKGTWMKKVLLSLAIVSALVTAAPASAHTKDHTRKYGDHPSVTLWQAHGGELSATRVPYHRMSFTFTNHSSHRIQFSCAWHEKLANGELQRRLWRGAVARRRINRAASSISPETARRRGNWQVQRGPHPTHFFPTDATCTLT